MPTPEKIVQQMDHTINQLIHIAEKMQHLSEQVVSEVELAPLQKKQEVLVDELAKLDEAFHKASRKPTTLPKIAAKLKKFQMLNAKFIENLKGSQKLIPVEAPPKRQKPAIARKSADRP